MQTPAAGLTPDQVNQLIALMGQVSDFMGKVKEGGTGVLIAAFVAHVLQYLKHSRWFPLMKEGEYNLNRFTAWVVAVATALGIHAGFSIGAHGWHFALDGPQTSWLALLGDIGRQYFAQKFAYSTTVGDHPGGG